MVYPLVSNMYYESQQKKLIKYYDKQVNVESSGEDHSAELVECQNYNQSLLNGGVLLTDPFAENQLDPSAMPYAGLLNTDGLGTMGYIEIPAIDVQLMIYHGTDAEVLAKGVGHLQGTSLPVGGTGTHCVLSAHTGLNDKKLFTDLDQLKNKDVFYIHVLGDTLAYQVDSIKVVEPTNTDDLKINANEDYCTLVTCTPYGINSHRLLVRGTRISYDQAKEEEKKTKKRMSTWTFEYLQALLTGIIALFVLFMAIYVYRKVKVRLVRKDN